MIVSCKPAAWLSTVWVSVMTTETTAGGVKSSQGVGEGWGDPARTVIVGDAVGVGVSVGISIYVGVTNRTVAVRPMQSSGQGWIASAINT